jgi:manganese transport protein
VATIGGCFFLEIFVLPATHPNFLEMGSAVLSPGLREGGMVVVAIGILGATVMPHNLYLHSALVQTRANPGDRAGTRRAIKFNALDTAVSLSLAFLVNAAILVLAAMVFHGQVSVALPDGGSVELTDDTDWIRVAYLTLTPLVGVATASSLFAIALLASGQSSTITGTLAGQIVMEGFIRWRVRPWVRRLVTRLIAVIPAVAIIGVRGDGSVTDLLVLSQVVLAMQLPFAMLPLLLFTSSRKIMGEFRSGPFLLVTGWVSCVLIIALDLYGLPESVRAAWDVIVGG